MSPIHQLTVKCGDTDSDESYFRSEIIQKCRAEAQTDLKCSSLKSPQNIRKTQGFCRAKTEVCLWGPFLSYSDVPLSGLLCLLLFTHFTLQSPESKRQEALSGSSFLHLYIVLFLLFLSYSVFFPLSSVLNRKVFQETLPLTKGVIIYLYLTPFMFQCGLKLQVCLFESSSLFLWIFHSLVFLLAFVFFLSHLSRSIKAIRSPNSAR